jgi:hypothetical protein
MIADVRGLDLMIWIEMRDPATGVSSRKLASAGKSTRYAQV